uniref:Uncharacterized protein n=1 Tax=Nothobranchius korthausae TaxID=1143690 RepID=A0A1A8HE93_9TELE
MLNIVLTTLRMTPAKKHAYEAQFKLQAISYAEKHGSRAAARECGVNRAFKVRLRTAWERWMTDGEHTFTKTGRQRRASYAAICEWIVNAWANVSTCTVVLAFAKAGIIHEETDGNETD